MTYEELIRRARRVVVASPDTELDLLQLTALLNHIPAGVNRHLAAEMLLRYAAEYIEDSRPAKPGELKH